MYGDPTPTDSVLNEPLRDEKSHMTMPGPPVHFHSIPSDPFIENMLSLNEDPITHETPFREDVIVAMSNTPTHIEPETLTKTPRKPRSRQTDLNHPISAITFVSRKRESRKKQGYTDPPEDIDDDSEEYEYEDKEDMDDEYSPEKEKDDNNKKKKKKIKLKTRQRRASTRHLDLSSKKEEEEEEESREKRVLTKKRTSHPTNTTPPRNKKQKVSTSLTTPIHSSLPATKTALASTTARNTPKRSIKKKKHGSSSSSPLSKKKGRIWRNSPLQSSKLTRQELDNNNNTSYYYYGDGDNLFEEDIAPPHLMTNVPPSHQKKTSPTFLKEEPTEIRENKHDENVDRLYGCSLCCFKATGCSECLRKSPRFTRPRARWCPDEGKPQDIEFAKTYRPTEEEFADPVAYITKIMPEASVYGIAHIVPPKGFKPPFAFKQESNGFTMDSFKFALKKQPTSKLCYRDSHKASTREQKPRSHDGGISPTSPNQVEGGRYRASRSNALTTTTTATTSMNQNANISKDCSVDNDTPILYTDALKFGKETRCSVSSDSLCIKVALLIIDAVDGKNEQIRVVIENGEEQMPELSPPSVPGSSSSLDHTMDKQHTEEEENQEEEKQNLSSNLSSNPPLSSVNTHTTDDDAKTTAPLDFGFGISNKKYTLGEFALYADWAKQIHFSIPSTSNNDNDINNNANCTATPPPSLLLGTTTRTTRRRASTQSTTTIIESPSQLSPLTTSTAATTSTMAPTHRPLHCLPIRYALPLDPSIEAIEAEFWRIVETPGLKVDALYGQDIEGDKHGSCFPLPKWRRQKLAEYRSKKQRNRPINLSERSNPIDEEYSNHPWNVNNMPRGGGSVLQYLLGDDQELITGVMLPWVYVGSCFSSFCWHIEDHALYSVNYMHMGAPKVWYGVPAHAAHAFEDAMKDALPHLFEGTSTLMYDLVTMLSPCELKKRGIPVYKIIHEANSFVITMPNAYHAGFNTGFNCAEAVNFAAPNWIPYGTDRVKKYKETHKPVIISHDALLVSLALAVQHYSDGDSLHDNHHHNNCQEENLLIRSQQQTISSSCCDDVPIQDQNKDEEKLFALFNSYYGASISRHSTPIEGIRLGVANLALRAKEEAENWKKGFEKLGVCDLPRVRVQPRAKNTSTSPNNNDNDSIAHSLEKQTINIITDTADLDCCICKADLWFAAITSLAAPDKHVCLEHASSLVHEHTCPVDSLVLVVRYSPDELDALIDIARKKIPEVEKDIEHALMRRENELKHRLKALHLGPLYPTKEIDGVYTCVAESDDIIT